MNDLNLLARLEDWYASHCNGEWEHSSGIKIETIDNPGWLVSFDLSGTTAEGCVLDRVVVETSQDCWLHYWSDGSVLHAASGPRFLQEALRVLIDQLASWER
ncbi:Imm53 family immunity protein [Streptomyces sp. LN549]|uniref:Imm53 family immunity protein n=1 Tax=Streptomyces sp. LN549 TaxID=3112979 RepID=UPI00371B631A